MARYVDEDNGVTTVDAEYIRPGIASIHLLIADGHAALFDTGTSLSLRPVIEVLKIKGLSETDVDFVIPTHVHLDHAGGAGTMMHAFPNATMIVHPRGAPHMADPTKLWAGTVAVYGEEKARALYGEVVPVDPERTIVANDGLELDFHGRTLRFLDTPGHARHHFCVIDTGNRIIFAGDTMGISYRMFDGSNGPFLFPTSSPVQFEPEALHQSIDRLVQTDPRSVYLTHFGRISPTPSLIDSLHSQIDDYVAIALECADCEDRTTVLRERIATYLFERAKLHGVPVDDRKLKAGLSMDARLNADGLVVWLDRRKQREDRRPSPT